MQRAETYLFCLLSIAGLSATFAHAEDATTPASTLQPWTKTCLNNDSICFIGSDIITECGVIASAVLIEQSGEAKKTLRIMLPTHVKRERGLNVAIDQAQPISRPFDPCYPYGCSAAYEAGLELVDQLKHGQALAVAAVDSDNSAIHRILPLAGFAEAYDGPPTPPKVFEVQTGELQRELEARAAGDAHDEEAPRKPPCRAHE
ncbi:MAG: invasion associated locus B family protein [Xanthobacteraceae bacterium]